MHIFDVIIFELRTVQQKTVKPTYLCPLGARKLAEGKGHETASMSYGIVVVFSPHCFPSIVFTSLEQWPHINGHHRPEVYIWFLHRSMLLSSDTV